MRVIGKLKDLSVKREKRPGLYADGGGLWLQVKSASSKSWIFRYFIGERDPATGKPVRDPATGRIRGRTREAGLGSLANVSLKEARELAADYRRLRAQGFDPLEQREGARRQAILDKAKALTFRQCAESYIASHRAGWRSERHAAQWAFTLTTYADPILGDLAVQTIDTALVLKVLKPIWETKTETASRIRGRIEAVLDAARAQGHIAQDVANPARWKGHLENLFPRRSKVRPVRRHAALPYVELPAFMAKLRARDSVATRALEFTILTAARTGEALGARWSEIDFAGKVWTIPGERMKAGTGHRIPLSARVADIIGGGENTGAFVFPGSRAGKPLSTPAMLKILERMGRADLTVHGFRSTFRDWAAERTNFPNHVVEMALAHTIGNAVEAAYRRGDLIEQRCRLMEAWSTYCSASPATMGEVVALNASRATTSA